MRSLRPLILGLALGLLAAAPLPAQQFESLPQQQPADQAAPAPNGAIGIINLQLAMARVQEGQKASEELQERFGPRRAELQKLQEEIQQLENQVRTQGRTLSEEALGQLQRQIDQKRRQGARTQEDLQLEIEQTQSDYVKAISEKLQRIITRLARERNLSVVIAFQSGLVVYAHPTVNITEDIIRLYDQTYPVQAA
ncbi:MAG: OmpH family outer membrane protein, partial [Terriglobia bacterium]